MSATRPAAAQTADTIYTGCNIVTIEDAQPTVEALAVKDRKILAVGKRAVVQKSHKGGETRIVDLAGGALLPGFIDSHGDYFNSLLVANQAKLYAPPSGPGKDVQSIIAELERFAAERKIPKGEMIMGYGYDDTVMPNGRLLNRNDLDAAFPRNPVRIDHVSMHGTVMNSLALEKYGISAATETPAGGIIVRKPGTNEPWGRISRAGAEIGPDQRVTPLEGLKAMTLWAAEQYGEEDLKGSLAPGKLADLVVLSANPLNVDPMTIKGIEILETIKEGKTVYRLLNQSTHSRVANSTSSIDRHGPLGRMIY